MKLYDKINNNSTYIIAEISANHAGKLDNALKLVEAAKNAGADCLKIQTYTPDTITINCDNKYFKIQGGLWNGYTFYNLYKEAYTPWEWQATIKKKCMDINIDFLSTPFDNSAVDFLEELGVEFYKISSFELVDTQLIGYVASKGKPIIISCGMGSVQEIEDAIAACHRKGNSNIILLKCCSEYPASYEDMNISTISDMVKRFKIPVGLSDHSRGYIADVVAVSLGACVIEKHICLDKSISNPDMEFSMTIDEFKQMVENVRITEIARGKPSYALSEREMAEKQSRRSLFVVKDIRKGESFTNENIRSIRPGNGISPKYYDKILGKTASQDILYGTPMSLKLIQEKLTDIW